MDKIAWDLMHNNHDLRALGIRSNYKINWFPSPDTNLNKNYSNM